MFSLLSHKASFSQQRYLHPLFPSLDINLLLNAIDKCRCIYMYIITEANANIWIHVMENYIENQID